MNHSCSTTFHAIFTALVLLSTAALAATQTVDGIEWTYTVSGNTASVGGGIGDDPAVSTNTTGAIAIPSTLGGHPVTSIGDWAFRHCRDLTSLTIPGSVTSIGRQALAGCSGLTSVTIPGNVTNIGRSAFAGCRGLTNLVISDGVTSIGQQAFDECSGLTSVTIPDSVTSIGYLAFAYCHSLQMMFAPASWESKYIEGMFWCNYVGIQSECKVMYSPLELAASERNFSALTATNQQLGVTANVSWIAASSAAWLTVKTASGNGNGTVVYDLEANTGMDARMATITVTGGQGAQTFMVTQHSAHEPIEWLYTVANGKVSLGTGSSENTAIPIWTTGAIVIPSTLGGYPVTDIGDFAFMGCDAITSVVIPSGVTDIERYAFWGCSSLTNVTIPNGVKEIGGYAFQLCSGLTSLVIPNSVTQIWRAAFIDCSGLTNVVIPNSVKGIDDFAFMCCTSLTNVTIPASVTSIGIGAFSGNMFSVAVGNPAYKEESGLLLTKDGKTLVCGVNGDVVIPGVVKSIENYAFHWCIGLTSVTIPNSVTNIGYSAFSECSSLTNVVIPDSVTCIQGETFLGCSGLTSVTIPDSVTSIGIGALACAALKTLYMPVSWQGKTEYGLTWDSYAGVPATCKIIYGEPEIPTVTTTGVPHSWLADNAADILAAHGGDYEEAAKASAANGSPVWQCFVVGLSTTEKEAKFKVKSIAFENGEPVVEWTPDLTEERAYKLLGKRTLADETWDEVPDGAAVDAEGWRFFRVRVELP